MHSDAGQQYPPTRLVSDIGGTHTRIALFDFAAQEFRALAIYTNRDHARFEDVMTLWLEALAEPVPHNCCIAVAAALGDDLVTMVNMDWCISRGELATQFGFARVSWINDFQANAYALPHLAPRDWEALNTGRHKAGDSLATLGPGTGLGGATLEWVAGCPAARACEPGHMGLSPATGLELELFQLLQPRHGEIHAELLVSGPGLQRLYQAVCEIQGEAAKTLSPAEISGRAQHGQDRLCEMALNTFCALLGSVSGDFVLANGAYGGLYLAGGIVPRIIPFVRASTFAQRFRDKGAMSERLDAVPLYAITAAQPGLIGAAHAPL